MDYYITLVAHIDEEKRPKNFPKQISATIPVTVENDVSELQQATNHFASTIIKSGGMIVSNPVFKGQEVKGITKETFDYDHNIFVPIHMITYIESVTSVKVDSQEESLVKLQ